MDQRRRQKDLEERARQHMNLPGGYGTRPSESVGSIVKNIRSVRTRAYEDPAGGGWKSRHYKRDRVYEIEGDDTIGGSSESSGVVRRVVRDVRRKAGARAKGGSDGRRRKSSSRRR